jgi:hypothetical protein
VLSGDTIGKVVGRATANRFAVVIRESKSRMIRYAELPASSNKRFSLGPNGIGE